MPITSKATVNQLEKTIIAGMKFSKMVKQNGRMYVSTAAFCERQTALSMTFEGLVDYDSSTSGYFEMGKAGENVVVNSLRNQNVLLYDNPNEQYRTLDIGLNLGGKIDAIYCLPDSEPRLLEVKTCGNTLPLAPHGEHLAQAKLYSAIMGLPVSIVYISRNIADYNGQIIIRDFDIEYDEIDLYETMYTVIFGKLSAERGLMPQIPPHLTKPSDCGFCQFKSICWDGKPSHLIPISKPESVEISHLTQQRTSAIINSSAIADRKSIVLNDLLKNGTPYAKALLSGNNG